MKEIWKPLYKCWKGVNYKGYYEISHLGQIRSVDKTILTKKGNLRYFKGRILKLSKSGSGDRYFQANLSINGNSKMYLVHRMVKYIFHGYSQLEVDHINSNILDNQLDNLEYVTAKENMKRAWDNGRITKEMCGKSMRGKFGKYHNRSKGTIQYSLDGKFIMEYGSLCEAERNTNIRHSGISACCSGKLKTSGGFKWEYT